MKSSVALFALFWLVSNPLSQAETRIEGTLERISDGDTVIIVPDENRFDTFPFLENRFFREDEKIRVRMIGMDAPESHLPAKGGMQSQGTFGDRATRYLKRLVSEGSTVTLIDFGHDAYRRTLGVVEHEGRDLNLAMIEGGWAEPYVICAGPTCNGNFLKKQKVAEYLAAGDRARNAEKGIFNSNDPLPESPFEFRMRMQDRDAARWVADIKTKKLYAPERYKKVDLCRRVFFEKKADAKKLGFEE